MAKRRSESELPRSCLPRAIIRGNVYSALRSRLQTSHWRAFVGGVEIESRRIAAFPDVVVTSWPLNRASPETAEPVLIAEALSPWTAHRWQSYCLNGSLRQYLVMGDDSRFVTLHTRTGPASFAETVHRDGTIELPDLGVALSLDEIYEDVTFPESSADG